MKALPAVEQRLKLGVGLAGLGWRDLRSRRNRLIGTANTCHRLGGSKPLGRNAKAGNHLRSLTIAGFCRDPHCRSHCSLGKFDFAKSRRNLRIDRPCIGCNLPKAGLLFPATLLALAAWLLKQDIARRTVYQKGLTRFKLGGVLPC